MNTPTLPLDIKILDPRILTEGWGVPGQATEGAAACDLRACAVYDSKPDGSIDLGSRRELTGKQELAGDTEVYIGCGFAMAARERGYVALLFPRSGLGARGLVLGNLVGVIDIADYRGEMIAAVWNRTPNIRANGPGFQQKFTIEPGDRICQMLVVPALAPDWNIVDELPPSLRGTGGFGSTGRG